VIVGSLRTAGFSRKTAEALIASAPASLDCNIVEIGQLSFFNQDLEENPPAEWVKFRDEVRPMDAVLFVTPEYNRSVPGVLKNAIDVGSRPYGHSVWSGKPGAVVSNSPGAIGGFGANHHLRQSLVFLNVRRWRNPKLTSAGSASCSTKRATSSTDETKAFFKGLWSSSRLGWKSTASVFADQATRFACESRVRL